MTTETGVSMPPRECADLNVPYPPSVVDRFMAWADRLPGPVWSFYLVLLIVLIVIINGITWLDGSVQFGTFDLYRTSVPFYPVCVLALMHYLNRVAHRALAAFRPALGASEAEYAWFEHELTTLPWRRTWGALGLSLLFTAAGLASTEARPQNGRPAWEIERDKILMHPLLRISFLRNSFIEILDEVRCFLQLREDTHFYATLALPVIRRTLLEFGRRLVGVGVIGTPEDVFHLQLNEIEQLEMAWPPTPQLTSDLQSAVVRRKEQRKALEGTPLVDPRSFRQTEAAGDNLLRGTPGSPGIAEGTVRIILDASEFGKLRSGDVLVAPYTNPSWTPLFQRAVAVVVDTGGSGSHAAIVAREYGIPAVMGTVDGTRRLKDGERIRVDGFHGLVHSQT